jgi:hypothetical protein
MLCLRNKGKYTILHLCTGQLQLKCDHYPRDTTLPSTHLLGCLTIVPMYTFLHERFQGEKQTFFIEVLAYLLCC